MTNPFLNPMSQTISKNDYFYVINNLNDLTKVTPNPDYEFKSNTQWFQLIANQMFGYLNIQTAEYWKKFVEGISNEALKKALKNQLDIFLLLI